MESYWGDAECQGYVRAMVVKKHTATDDSQLSLTPNEKVIILEQDETGWWGGHKEGQEEKTGWFPGSCVRILSPVPCQDGKLANSALESVPSPARQSYKAVSPERSERGQEARDQGRSRSQNSYQELVEEYEHLKRDKAMLEERLQKMQRKSGDDQKALQKTTAQLKVVETQLRDSEAKLQAERKQKAALQEENARLKEDNARLKENLQQATAIGTADPRSSQKLRMDAAQDDRAKHTNEMRAPATSNAPSTLASVSSAAEEGEAPPIGTVKKIKDEFERRSTTPQRPERERHGDFRPGSLGNMGSRDAPLPPSLAGRFAPVDRRSEGDVDFGLSPIRRGSGPKNFFPGEAKYMRAST